MENGGDGSSVFNDFLTASAKLKQSITSINDVNMQAVVRKSNLTKHDSVRFKNSMALIGTICFMLALGYFWYFPVYISTTISYLSDKMKNLLKISGITLDIQTKDEAYIILQAINLLENKSGVKKKADLEKGSLNGSRGLLKNAHLLCCAANRTAQCISIYASRLGFLRASHLNIFEQPPNMGYFNNPINL